RFYAVQGIVRERRPEPMPGRAALREHAGLELVWHLAPPPREARELAAPGAAAGSRPRRALLGLARVDPKGFAPTPALGPLGAGADGVAERQRVRLLIEVAGGVPSAAPRRARRHGKVQRGWRRWGGLSTWRPVRRRVAAIASRSSAPFHSRPSSSSAMVSR